MVDQMGGESESVGSNLSWPSMKVEWKELLQSKLSGLVGETSHCWAGVIGRPTPPQYFAALLLLLSCCLTLTVLLRTASSSIM